MAMKSMTGYGRGEALMEELRFEAEISSVNRKQLDVAPALPREAGALESVVRRMVGACASRGRVSVRVRFERHGQEGSGKKLKVDHALLDEYRRSFGDLLGDLPVLAVEDVLRMPGVIELVDGEMEESVMRQGVEAAVSAALEVWDGMRVDEGSHLAGEISTYLKSFAGEVEAIEKGAPRVPEWHRTQLLARLEAADLPVDLGDDRMVREIALFADRCDISEELARLRSHLSKFRGLVAGEESAGRPLDFLIQEMNREVNTMGAKANDAELAHRVVAAKSLLEKIREQLQNVE